MVLLGQGMEPEGSPAIVQVVYYLCRAGQLQQPHLIDVTVSPHSNGLYLRDVKERLTAIRGKGVADSYSWSCKRNYKDNYIWQDLTDDDKILPLGDGEFVLKGSGLYAGYRIPGKNGYLDGPIDPERMSLSPKQDSAKLDKKVDTSKKFDFVAVKRSLDLHADHLPDQNELAAALALSFQLMNNPHGHSRRFSKDKSMDLNQQVMNSLSQAKAGPAEECTLDQYDMSSNETYLSEESTTRKNFRQNSTTAEHSKSTSSSSRTDMNCQRATAKQVERKDRPICANNGPKVDVARGRQEKPEELPSIKTKAKASSGNEPCETTAFMLSPRRIMAVLSTPEKRLGKILHSSSTRSSGLTNSTSTHSVEPLSAIKLSKQTTCLSQLRFCSQLSHQATDSRPDSPVRQNSMEVLVQSSAMPQSPTVHGHGGQYWARWKAGRKFRASEAKVVTDEPSTPTQAETPLPEDKTTSIRRVLTTSFEFERPVNNSSSGPGTPSLHTRTSSSTESSNPPSLSRKLVKPSSSDTFISSADTPYCLNMSSTIISNAEVMTPIAVKEVITEHLPIQQSTSDSGQNFSCGAPRSSNGKDESTRMHSMADSGQDFSIDTSSLPRVSISDSISAVRAPVHVRATRSESPESPLNPNPPCSPVRTNSPAGTRSPGRTLSSPASFNRRAEDGRARARGLVKEVAPKDCRFMKDLAKELERSKVSSSSMRSIASSTRASGIKNGTTSIGGSGKSISSTFNRSPPRISSMLWEDPPHAPKQPSSIVDRDDRPLTAGRSIIDWEKTLQESASVSLPPPDFGQILQECGQCGRTFKPDSLKVHMRSCHSLRRRNFTHSTAPLLLVRDRQ